MKMHTRFLLTWLFAITLCHNVQAQKFDDHFENNTLRLDYIFSGNNEQQNISLVELSQSPEWYGRRGNLDKVLLQGNGQLCVTDSKTKKVIYRYSFSSLFQEWQSTEEATQLTKSFENTFLVPFPKSDVDIQVTLTDTHNKVTAKYTHHVNPNDILIRKIGQMGVTPWKYVYKANDPQHAIDIAIVAEGYTEQEMDLFEKDCQMCVEAYHQHEPFKSLKDKFNFIAVCSPSVESGVSIPHKQEWRNTVLGGNYDTFYSERYLTTLNIRKLHNMLAGIPYEHIIILVNTDNYGGGGIYNSYMMSSAHHAKTRPVIVHEFGHSFGGLGDEYFYDDQYETMYPSDTEPWEPNLTTLVDFDSKWKDMLGKDTPIPTPNVKSNDTKVLGVYEGGGYQSKGVYRPVMDCRMKTNECPTFCPVCDRAIRRMVEYHLNRE